MKNIDKTIKLFELPLASSTQAQLLKNLEEILLGRYPLIAIATPNPEQVVQSTQSSSFLRTLQKFELLLPDGVGLVWASRILNQGRDGLSKRVAGTDVVLDLLAVAQRKNLKVLVIGGREYGSAGQQTAFLHTLYPELHLPESRWLAGFSDVSHPTAAEQTTIITTIKDFQPDLVFVAFGAPWQEQWVQENRVLLQQSGVRVAMVVGGAFDYILGKVPRAPQWLRELGGEWLYRLLAQPWRWRRQLRLLQFVLLVVRERMQPS
jgi:N-acetylglucosaminyldiphosphoundecaprenol N-acetyl-beta-D-mannosaminyltransferase